MQAPKVRCIIDPTEMLCRKCLYFSNSLLAKNVVKFLARVVSIHHKIVRPESAEDGYLIFTQLKLKMILPFQTISGTNNKVPSLIIQYGIING